MSAVVLQYSPAVTVLLEATSTNRQCSDDEHMDRFAPFY